MPTSFPEVWHRLRHPKNLSGHWPRARLILWEAGEWLAMAAGLMLLILAIPGLMLLGLSDAMAARARHLVVRMRLDGIIKHW